jgi:hypothetical protein
MFCKKILSGFVMVFTISESLYGQNLVPNPSFEDTIQCPTAISVTFDQVSYATGWYTPTSGTPDYFHSCNGAVVGVPQNYIGMEPAKSGVAYTGIYTTSINGMSNSYREYIQTQLMDTLKAGTRYYVSFYVSPGDSCGYRCNSIGAYLSQTAISSTNSTPLPFIPKISNPSTNPLVNQNGWTLVADTFTATGGELYITIGNFYNGYNSDTINVGGGSSSLAKKAYYYIDDVSVVVDSAEGINTFDNENLFKVYPNPTSTELKIFIDEKQNKEYVLKIYNSIGNKILERNFSKQTNINTSSFSKGIYQVQICDGNGKYCHTEKVVLQ